MNAGPPNWVETVTIPRTVTSFCRFSGIPFALFSLISAMGRGFPYRRSLGSCEIKAVESLPAPVSIRKTTLSVVSGAERLLIVISALSFAASVSPRTVKVSFSRTTVPRAPPDTVTSVVMRDQLKGN